MNGDGGREHLVPVTKGSRRFQETMSGDLQVIDAWFPPGAYLERHAHERRVFSIMLDGSFDLVFSGRKLDCRPSTIFTEPGGESHANRMGSAGAHLLVVQPAHDMELVEPCDRMLGRINYFQDGTIAGLARRVVREIREPDEVSDLAIHGLVLEMLVLAARRTRSDRMRGRPPAWFRRVEEMVHERFREKLLIDDLAGEAGVHPAHVARVFRSRYDMSVGEFIRQLRLEWATTELVSTDESISSIAFRAGFADQSHFSRTFRRAKGMPPGRFRKTRES